MKRSRTALLIATMILTMSVPASALDGVPQDSATTLIADDGTVVYCVFDITTDEDGNVTGVQFTDCPEAAFPSPEGAEPIVTGDIDLNNLQVGDSVVFFRPYTDEHTTITLQRVESGVKTSRYSKPDQGMTTLAVFYTFEASPTGGRSSYRLNAFSPDGEPCDSFYGALGKYDKDWAYGDLRPGRSTKGWEVFEVPKKGTVELVMQGYDEEGEEVFATWVVQP